MQLDFFGGHRLEIHWRSHSIGQSVIAVSNMASLNRECIRAIWSRKELSGDYFTIKHNNYDEY